MGILSELGLDPNQKRFDKILEALSREELKEFAEKEKITVNVGLLNVSSEPNAYDHRRDISKAKEIPLSTLMNFIKKKKPELYQQMMREIDEKEHIKQASEKEVTFKSTVGEVFNSIPDDNPENSKPTRTDEIIGLLERAESEDMRKEQDVGTQLENILESYYRSKKYSIVARNLDFNGREVDLIIARGDVGYMVEAKFKKMPVSMKEHDGIEALYTKLKNSDYFKNSAKYKNLKLVKLIYVAPIGGVARNVENQARANDELEVHGKEFRQELIDFGNKIKKE